MSKTNFLDSITVKTPCSQDWTTMRGSEEVRFCDHCAKDVHNLSQMTRKKARRLVAQSNGDLCVRYVRRPDGGIQTIKNTLHQITRQTGIAAGVLGTSLAVSAAGYAQTTAEPTPIDQTQTVEVVGQSSELLTGGTISGTITDPNGAVIPFALVTISNEQTYLTQNGNADQNGFYEFKDLPNGTYKIKYEANGFAARESAQISISGGDSQTQDAQMTIETMQEVVVVGDLPEIRSTIQGGAILVTSYRHNKLVMAVESDDLEAVKTRVMAGDRVNSKDKGYDKNTPLHVAVANGNLEIVQFLLIYGAKTNGKNDDKRTPLMMLDQDANAEIVNSLLRYGAKINAVDKRGDTPLILAAENAGSEVVQALLNSGANVNAVNKLGETALMRAAENGELENVKTLLGAGANAQIKTRDGATALSMTNSAEVREFLIAYGAEN